MRGASIAALILLGCANGDGRGFATVEGTMVVGLDEPGFVTASGEPGTITALTAGVDALRLEATTPLEDGDTLVVSSTLPIGAHWAPLEGQFLVPFGPYEVDGADYDTLAVVVTRLDVTLQVGERMVGLEVLSDEGIPVRTPADLPANRERPPLITLSAALNLSGDVLDGFDPDAGDAAEELARRLEDLGIVSATWTRKSD